MVQFLQTGRSDKDGEPWCDGRRGGDQRAGLSKRDGANGISGKYFDLYGVRRDFYTCAVPLTAETITLELHDTVEIKLPRFGLAAGKNMRVITQQIDCDKREITYGLWG